MRNQRLALSITAALGIWIFCSNNACATTWYVRDGGGNPSQCTGTTNAVYPGSGANQPCAFSNPMYALGAGCGNESGGQSGCDVAPLMTGTNDILYIVGDSDINPGQQAQYPIGLDTTGVITPINGNNCYGPVPENCTMGSLPPNASIIGIGSHRPQLWAREHLAQVINDNNSTSTVINNLEITQHSACVYNGADPAGTTDGFPNACHTSDNGFSSPYGNWGLAGISLTGSNITLENNWIHGMAQWGVSTGSLTNFTETNNIISGNGGGGMGLGQNISNAGTMTLGGTTTVNGDVIVFNGCGSTYPLHSSDPFDTLNYHNCADDSSSNGTILADGWAMEAGSGICTNVNMSNTIVAYNTKGGVDNLHCNGTGTFTAYRVRVEGNESQQMKLNYGTVNVENSQIINDCNFFKGQPFTTTCDSYGSCPPALGNDFCRAAGDGLRILLNNGNTYHISNSTFYSDGGANIEFPQATCSGAVVNINNNLVINGPDYTNGDGQQTDFYENDTGSCSPVVENNNLVYQPNDPSDCAGSHDICNPSSPGVSGNFTLNSSYVYTGTGLADQFYPSAGSPLIGAANSALILNGTTNDYNNYARSSSSWDIGSYQHGSSVANGSACFSNTECASAICSNNFCSGTVAAPQPVVSITSPASASSFSEGSNITISAAASESNGTITNISLYNGSTLLGSSSASPFNFVMSDAATGTYNLTAKATDVNGVSVTSSTVSMTVTAQSVLPSSPVVSITSPANGSSFTSGSNVTVTASASETNGTISNISIYSGLGLLLGSGNTSLFNFLDTALLPGTYSFYAVATDANGVSTTSSSISITVTAPVVAPTPTVAITSPANGSTYTGVSNITLTASASETNGTIAQVKFYDGSVPLSYVGTSAPYSYVWNNVQPGTYTMTAQATDANGVVVSSAPITITVNTASAPAPTYPPVVSITAPANAASFTSGSNVTITASASETNGTISSVAFYNGTTLLGTSTSSPYSFTWDNVAAGSYTLTAKATDANSVSTTSAAVSVTVTAPIAPPVVAITSPTNNSSLTAGTNMTVTANVTDANSTISVVSFYNGNTLLGSTTTDPDSTYSINVSNLPAGTNTLTAVATNTNGLSTTSSPVSVTVTATPPTTPTPVVTFTSPANGTNFATNSDVTLSATATEANGTINYLMFYNGATPLGHAVTSSPYTYDWKSVKAGTYSLTARATDINGVTVSSAVVTINVGGVNPPVSTNSVTLTSPVNNASYTVPASVVLTASASDSGATIARVDYYASGIYLGEATASPFTVTWTSAQAGTYSVTAIATDSSANTFTSAPVSITVNAHAAPTISLTAPANNASYTPGSNLVLTANASANGGSITKVDFYNGSLYLGTAYSSPYSFTWDNVQAGTYSLTAKATDSYGWSNTSGAVNVTVAVPVPQALPVVAITSPANAASFTAGNSMSITASASETNGTISSVSFYNGATLLGTDTSSPYSYTWNNLAAGSYTLTAKATDINGVSTTSSPVSVTVTAVVLPPVVAITSPTNNSSLTAGSNITITANVTDTNGTISLVSFYNGSTLLGSTSTDPDSTYSINVPMPAGTYTLTATATNTNGASTTSSPVTVTVAPPASFPPVVTITSPANNSAFATNSKITITASASETNGTIKNVSFYIGLGLLGSTSVSPYTITVPSLPSGTYNLIAKATDANGVTVSSNTVAIMVSSKNHSKLL